MQIKLNGSLLLDKKTGKPMSFAKMTQDQLEVLFAGQDVEIVHEGGSSKISREKAVRLGIIDAGEQEKFFAIAKKFEACKSELKQLLTANKCYYIVDGTPTKTLVGFDWYIQNIDKPDSKLVEKVRKARETGIELEEEEEVE